MMILFVVVALLAVISGVGVVAFKNPIFCALSLVANLLAIAVTFAMLDAHFLAAVQVIVYAGAIMVLVLFMLMLLNVKAEKQTRSEKAWTVFAVLVGGCFLVFALPLVNEVMGTLGKSGPHGGILAMEGTVEAMGLRLFREYGFLFQASGVLLMVAIVGAVMLAKKSYRPS